MGEEFDGVAMVPGVSLNRRLYTRELIGKAVARAQERVRAGLVPLTMLTHHAAEDDSTRIVGGITEIWQDEDGAARFRARFADTAEAATISQLVKPKGDAPPFLRGVSIRGWWLGEVRRVIAPDGSPADTADDLELDGVDFTKTPGVILAGVTTDESALGGRTMVRESVTPAGGHVGGAHPATPPATVVERFADLGYLGERRLPLTTPRQAIETWHTLATDEGTKGYTRPQTKRLRQRTREALTGHGLTVAEDGTVLQRVAEGFAWGWDQDGSMQVRLSNGPIDVAVSTWCVDPAALDAIGMAAMRAALDALGQLDPDADGDIDVGTTAETAERTGRQPATETAPADATSDAAGSTTEAAPAEDTDDEQEPAAMGDTTPAAETAAPEALTTAHLPALAEAIGSAVAAAIRPPATEATPAATAAAPAAAPAAPAQPATETAAPAGYVSAADVERMLAEQRNALRQEIVGAYGTPRRRGLVTTAPTAATETAGPAAGQAAGGTKAPHEMSAEEFDAWSTGLVDQLLPG